MVLQVLVRGDHFMDWWISPSWARNQPNNYRGGELDAEERSIVEVLLIHPDPKCLHGPGPSGHVHADAKDWLGGQLAQRPGRGL